MVNPGGYFSQTQFVSNSELGKLKKVMSLEQEMSNLQQIFNFGSLLDAHLTEPDSVSRFEVLATDDEKTRAKLMKQAGEADPTLSLWLKASKTQHEVYRNNFEIEYDGFVFNLPFRIKMDFLHKPSGTGADLKSTACTKQEDFLKHLLHFEYDRQAASYMDVAKLDRFLFIGISKKAVKGVHRVFKHAVVRGDDFYNQGKKKYSYLGLRYYFYIHNFQMTSIITKK